VPPTSQTGLCNARIQKSATGVYLSGQSVTWTINYGNNGSGVCNNVIITDLGGINNAMVSGTIVATLGSLIPGQTGLLTINSTVYGTS